MASKVQDFLIFRLLGHDVMVHREIDIRHWFGDGNSTEKYTVLKEEDWQSYECELLQISTTKG